MLFCRARLSCMPLVLALLAGCASSAPPATRYMLPAGDFVEAAGAGEAERTLVVQAPRLAGYLDTAGIVLQLDDITLNEAAGHRWAEDLALQLQRTLRRHLAERLEGTRVVGEGGGVPGALQLRVEVQAFHGRHDGVAIAAGTWQLRDATGALVAQRPFRVETRLPADGYPALVRALGQSWDEVAERIAEGILNVSS